MTPDSAVGFLKWCIEIGDDELIGEVTVDRFGLNPREDNEMQKGATQERLGPAIRAQAGPDGAGAAVRLGGNRVASGRQPAPDGRLETAVADASSAASGSGTLESLKQALSQYEHCELKGMAQNLVFSDGLPTALVMIIGEAPGADEDRLGRPFVGRAGRLLDRMFAEIDLSRKETSPERSFYITNILPWRPPGNRNPNSDEIAMMLPFIRRHVRLAEPRLLVLMGNISCNAFLGQGAITRRHGNWHDWQGIPVMPMFHPAYLLRNPVAKGGAWIDLLKIRSFLVERGMR